MFSLGDIIVCVNNSGLGPDVLACPLKLGQEFEVIGLRKCPCGEIFIDIGLSLSSNKFDIVCLRCKRRLNDGIWWFGVARFRKKAQPTTRAIQIDNVEELKILHLN